MFKETDRVELKRELNDSLKKEIVAFANTNGGKIYIGIDDEGEVVGINEASHVMESISSMIHDAIRPDLRMFTSIKTLTVEGKEVIEIEVLKGTKKPYHIASKGMKPSGVFIRHGITSQPASEEFIRQLISENHGVTFEKTRCINQSLTFEYAEKFFSDRNIRFESSQKRTLGIINEDDYYTNLGLLLSDQCEHSIKCAIYNGNNKLTFKDRKEFEGSLLKQLEEAYQYISIYNKTGATFEGLKRIDRVDYPSFAIRETLINAIVHRDYSFNGSILVHIFDNRIECVSTGGLVSGLTKEDIISGVSESRNRMLANCFYRLELIESYGTGIQRILESYQESNKKPSIKISDHAFVVTLPNMTYTEKEKTKKEQILELFLVSDEVTRIMIEEMLGASKSTARLLINELLDEGKIVKKGIGKNTVYIKAI